MKKRGLVFALLCLGLVVMVLLPACGTPGPTTTTSKPPLTTTAASPFITPTGAPAPVVESIVADPASVSLEGKATTQLRITAVYDNEYQEVVTFQSRYSSGDTKIVTVSVGGLVTAIGAGTTNIEVSYTLGKTTKTVKVPVTVK
jgi:hypothetical protein